MCIEEELKAIHNEISESTWEFAGNQRREEEKQLSCLLLLHMELVLKSSFSLSRPSPPLPAHPLPWGGEGSKSIITKSITSKKDSSKVETQNLKITARGRSVFGGKFKQPLLLDECWKQYGNH